MTDQQMTNINVTRLCDLEDLAELLGDFDLSDDLPTDSLERRWFKAWCREQVVKALATNHGINVLGDIDNLWWWDKELGAGRRVGMHGYINYPEAIAAAVDYLAKEQNNG